MFLFWFSIGLTVLSNVIYHMAQKLTPSQANPMLSLAVTYVLAVIVSVVLLPFFPLQGGLVASMRQLNWSAAALALAVVGLELGFLLRSEERRVGKECRCGWWGAEIEKV